MAEAVENTNPGAVRVLQGGRRPKSLLRTVRDIVKIVAPIVAGLWAAFTWVQGRFDRIEARMDRQFEFLLREIRDPQPAPPPHTSFTRQEP